MNAKHTPSVLFVYFTYMVPKSGAAASRFRERFRASPDGIRVVRDQTRRERGSGLLEVLIDNARLEHSSDPKRRL